MCVCVYVRSVYSLYHEPANERSSGLSCRVYTRHYICRRAESRAPRRCVVLRRKSGFRWLRFAVVIWCWGELGGMRMIRDWNSDVKSRYQFRLVEFASCLVVAFLFVLFS